MTVRAYIVLAEAAPGRLVSMQPSLEALGLFGLPAHSAADALHLVRKNPLVGILLAEQDFGADAAELISTLKRLHPDLPVLWMGDGPVPELDGAKPDVVLSSNATTVEIRAHAERLLCSRLYPHDVVEIVSNGAISVLANSFSTRSTVGPAYLKANRYTLAPLTAIVSFSGPGIAGRVVTSATHEVLSSVFRAAVPGTAPASEEEAEDVAGELANQVAGLAKSWFSARGRPFDITSPVYVCGDLTAVRYKAGRPSLVLPLELANGPLFVQFCFDTYDPTADALTEESVEWGEIELL